jgi:hypothetical protein
MPMKVELLVPAVGNGWEKQAAESAWRRYVGMFRSAQAYSTFRPEPRMGASADFCIACLWSALGLTLTGLLLALGSVAEIGQILAAAG